MKDFAAVSNTTQIKKLLDVLGQEFAMSQNPNCRKGGLIGLAATAIALGKVIWQPYFASRLRMFNFVWECTLIKEA